MFFLLVTTFHIVMRDWRSAPWFEPGKEIFEAERVSENQKLCARANCIHLSGKCFSKFFTLEELSLVRLHEIFNGA
ncbi:MAG: hypothetical protein ACREOO_15640 [bacterium]